MACDDITCWMRHVGPLYPTENKATGSGQQPKTAPELSKLGGLGTALLEAARSGVNHLQLWVFQGNAQARYFYSRQGFFERDFTNGQRNEEKMPDLRMEWTRCN